MLRSVFTAFVGFFRGVFWISATLTILVPFLLGRQKHIPIHIHRQEYSRSITSVKMKSLNCKMLIIFNYSVILFNSARNNNSKNESSYIQSKHFVLFEFEL
ncbi:unnamed protein product, partial [Schistosoma rodhaini]